MKRKLNILLIVILTFAMVATAAFAVEEAPAGDSSAVPQMQMIAETTGASLDALAAGDTVTVYVKAPAVAMSGLQFKVNFDTDVFMYDDYDYVSNKNWLSVEIGVDNVLTGKVGYAAGKGENKTPDADWNIFTLILKVKDGAKSGATSITMTELMGFYYPADTKDSTEFKLQAADAVTLAVKGTTGDSSTETPSTGDPTPGKPTTGDSTTGKPTTGTPTTGTPTTGTPTTGTPTTGTPTTGTPTTGTPTTGTPTTGTPTTGTPTTGTPTTGNPTTGNPTTGNTPTDTPTTGVTVSGTAISWNSTDDAVYLLYKKDTTDADIKAEWQNGSYETSTNVLYTGTKGVATENTEIEKLARWNQTFSFEAVESGEYKLVIFKPGKYVPKIVNIKVEGTDYNAGEQKLWLYGDVNYDGEVAVADGMAIYRKTASKTSIFDKVTDSDILLAADINMDGEILVADGMAIYRKAANKTSAFDLIK